MSRAYSIKKIPYIVLGLVSLSCAPLKEVGTFATSSNKAMQDASFTYSYYDYARDSSYILLDDKNDSSSVKELRDVDCTKCSNAIQLDTLIKNEFASVTAYYGGLAKLAGSSLIDLSPVSKAMSAGTYAGVTISNNEASYFNEISAVASNLVTTRYRSKEIKKIVKKHSVSVQEALDLLIIHIDNMSAKIKDTSMKYELRFTNWIGQSKTYQEKWLLIDRYKQKTKEFEDAIFYFDNLKKSVEKIKAGDKLLSDNINQLKDERFKKQIMDFAANIIYLNSKTKN